MVESDFQVITGGDGLDITFWATSPTNVVMTHQEKKKFGKTKFTSITGVYTFCYDNSFSQFTAKNVHFYIGIFYYLFLLPIIKIKVVLAVIYNFIPK